MQSALFPLSVCFVVQNLFLAHCPNSSVKLPCWAAQAHKPASSAPCTVVLKHLALKFEIDQRFPKLTQHVPLVPSPCSRSTCCRSISTSSLSSKSGTPDLLVNKDLLAQNLLPQVLCNAHFCYRLDDLFVLKGCFSPGTSIFRLQTGVLMKWAEARCTPETGRISSAVQDSLLGPIQQLSSFLVLPETAFLTFFFSTCSFGRVSSSSSITVLAHQSSSHLAIELVRSGGFDFFASTNDLWRCWRRAIDSLEPPPRVGGHLDVVLNVEAGELGRVNKRTTRMTRDQLRSTAEDSRVRHCQLARLFRIEPRGQQSRSQQAIQRSVFDASTLLEITL